MSSPKVIIIPDDSIVDLVLIYNPKIWIRPRMNLSRMKAFGNYVEE